VLVNSVETSESILWVKSWENAIWLDVVVDIFSLFFFGVSIFILLFGKNSMKIIKGDGVIK
jgi:hypothetical protein